MKRLLLLLAFLAFAGTTMAQQKTDTLPYIKYPTLPAFRLQLLDSTIFNMYYVPEGKPTVLLFFSPDCEHCRDLTLSLLGKMDSLSNAQFYLFTPMPMASLVAFNRVMNLKQYPNITVGRDFEYFFPAFYGINKVPYLVVYDRHKKLVRMYDGHVKMEELIRVMSGL